MFTKKTMLRAAGASLAVVLSLAVQPARAQGSDAERLQKLEQAVSQLQKRNAELEQEVSGLKKRTSWAPVVGAEGKTKTEVTSDGKTYVEKLVPELHGGEKWKLFLAICVCGTNIEVADFPTTFSSVRITLMTGRSANASAIVCASDCGERFWMIGSLGFG